MQLRSSRGPFLINKWCSAGTLGCWCEASESECLSVVVDTVSRQFPRSGLGCSCFRRDEDNAPRYGNGCRPFDALFILAFQRTRPRLGLPHTFPPSNPPPSLCWPWSIQPCLPVPHVIFFLWHGSPLPTAWYAGVGMHAPSQIHQLRSECRTTARGNKGMRKERGGGRKQGREREREGRSVACRHPSGTKASNWRAVVVGVGMAGGKGKGKRNSSFFFLWGHFC